MKKITIVVSAMALLLFVGALQAQEHKGPRIEVKQERYDAGKVVAGQLVTHVYEIKNSGDEPLLIDRVQPS